MHKVPVFSIFYSWGSAGCWCWADSMPYFTDEPDARWFWYFSFKLYSFDSLGKNYSCILINANFQFSGEEQNRMLVGFIDFQRLHEIRWVQEGS